MHRYFIEKVLVIAVLSSVTVFAEVDLQKGMYDAADEMMQLDEKMNRLIAEHNQIDEEKDKEMRANDNLIQDFEESQSGYVLEQNIDDVNNTKIEVELKDGELTVSTTTIKKEESVNGTEKSYKTTERTSSTSLSIPNDADENTMQKHYENGILKIEFLKKK